MGKESERRYGYSVYKGYYYVTINIGFFITISYDEKRVAKKAMEAPLRSAEKRLSEIFHIIKGSKMKITDVKTTVLSLPHVSGFKDATIRRMVQGRTQCFVHILTDEGLEGLGLELDPVAVKKYSTV